MADGEGQGDAAEADSACRIAENHHALAVPAVDESPGGQAENEVGECTGSPNKTGLGGRVREGQDEKGEGDVRDLRSNRGDDLAAP